MHKATLKKPIEKPHLPKAEERFIFGQTNYLFMLLGVVFIATGFTLMSGTDDIFSTTKLTVAPILVIIGFIIELFAIFRKN